MQMRAAVLEEFGQPLAVQQVELADPKAGEVLVRLAPQPAHQPVPGHPRAAEHHRIKLDDVNHGFELMEAQDGIRSVIDY